MKYNEAIRKATDSTRTVTRANQVIPKLSFLKLKLPCFLRRLLLTLLRSISNAAISFSRVSRGLITSSTYPRCCVMGERIALRTLLLSLQV